MIFVIVLNFIESTNGNLFLYDYARKACITPCPNLVTESQKYAKSHDFREKSHFWSVVLH